MSLVAESHGVTGRQAPAATVLHAIENLGHGRLGRKPFQVVEKVFLQAHPRRPGTTAQHEMHLVGHALDLNVLGHGSMLAPMEPIQSLTTRPLNACGQRKR